MTINDPRQSSVEPQPGRGGGGWIAAFIILIVILIIVGWSWDSWRGGTNNSASNPAPQATTNGSRNAPSGAATQQPETTGRAPSSTPSSGNNTPSDASKKP